MTYLADAREHIDGRPEVPDMEHGQGELDVTIVANTFRGLFPTSLAFSPFFIWALS